MLATYRYTQGQSFVLSAAAAFFFSLSHYVLLLIFFLPYYLPHLISLFLLCG